MERGPTLPRSAADVLVDLKRDGRGWILLFVSFGWFLTLGVRIVYPALLPQVAAEFEIGYSTSGVLIGTLWVSYALLQFPGGLASDWLGERAVLLLSVLFAMVAIVTIVASTTLVFFFLATVALGVGTGFYGTTRVTVLSAVYSHRDTTAISISQAAGNLGNVILPVCAGFLSVYTGWRWGFGMLVPFLAVTAIGFWLVVPGRVAQRRSAESFVQTLGRARRVITNARIVKITAVLLLTMFLFQSVTGFLPTYLADIKDVSPRTATVLFGLFFTSAAVFQFCSGIISDRYDRRLAMIGFVGLSVPAFVALTVLEGRFALAGIVIALGSMLGGFPPAHAYATRAVPSEVRGSGYGLVRTIYIVFGALGPVTVGILADYGFFDEAFLMLGGVALLTCLVSTRLPSL